MLTKNCKYRILVIDDEPDFNELVAKVFEEDDILCDAAFSDEEARKKWGITKYDAIILDLAMDEQTFTPSRQVFCEEVRKKLPSVPIIAVTGKPMSALDGFRLAGFKIDAFYLKQKMNVIEFRENIEQLIIDYSSSDTQPSIPVSLPTEPPGKPSIFISYAHNNKVWLEYFLERLAPYTTLGNLTYWVDTDIKIGKEWDEAIKEAIDYAEVAVLLVSNAFLSSQYILEVELPYIFKRKRAGDLKVVWFCIEKCPYDLIADLKNLQAAHNPDDPLDNMNDAKRGAVLASISKNIERLISG